MPEAQTPVVPDDGLTTAQRRRRPLVIVHTDDGKGKTTAAMGLALRAWHRGWPVGVFQFVKSAKWRTGEEAALRALGDVHATTGAGAPVTWEAMGLGWTWSRPSLDAAGAEASEPADLAREGWEHVKTLLQAQTHTLYVLDEFTYPVARGWVDADDVVATLASRPGTQHVVVTGRRCPEPILDAADLVTEMTKVRHPFDAGQRGQAGIEW